MAAESSFILKQKLDRLAVLKQQLKDQEALVSATRRDLDILQDDIHEHMTASGLKTINTADYRHTAVTRVAAVVQDRKAFIDWCGETGQLDSFTVVREAKQRLNELVRGIQEEGGDMPPGLGYYPKNYVSTTRLQAKESA